MIDIKKLRKEKIKACKISHICTKPLNINYYETYYNEKGETIKIPKKYESNLYGSIYKISWKNYIGVVYTEGIIALYSFDDLDYNIEFEWDIEKVFETKEEVLEEFINKTDKRYYILFNEKANELYTLSTFFDKNTKENIDKYIEIVMKNNNSKITILRSGE